MSKKLPQRVPKTTVKIRYDTGSIFHEHSEHIAQFWIDAGMLRIVFTDGSQITYGPAWKWSVHEEAE